MAGHVYEQFVHRVYALTDQPCQQRLREAVLVRLLAVHTSQHHARVVVWTYRH